MRDIEVAKERKGKKPRTCWDYEASNTTTSQVAQSFKTGLVVSSARIEFFSGQISVQERDI